MQCTTKQRSIELALAAYSPLPSKGMVGKELETGTVDCRFPNVRKTYWRSATWSSHSAPPSPKLPPFSIEGNGFPAAPSDVNIVPSTPRAQEHNQSARSRAPLPPLQPLSISKKSLDEWPSAGLDDLGGDWPPVPATPGGRKAKNSLDIKLDLASIQRTAVEPTEIQLKRDKFAHFDKQCSRVADYHIYLGSDAVARDRETLRANGITHVLNCVGFVCPEYFKGELNYKTLWLQDSPCEDITSLLYDVFDYFEDVREQGGRVFVHCCQGVSRSTSLVIAYLMWRERSSFEDAFQDVKAARGVTNPNMGFACQLLQCQKRVHAMPMSPNAVLRMYRLAPHSPYDPLHLVPKALSNPGAGCLDSRGAFVIHLPDRILVWIGEDCDPKIAQAAKEAAGQVVRYERAEGPIQVMLEGSEGPEFWERLSKYSVSQSESSSADGVPSLLESNLHAEKDRDTKENEVERVRQLGAGNRKVPFYDGDYALYKIARVGGIIPPVPFTGVGVGMVTTRIPARDDGWSVIRRKFLSGKLALVKEIASRADGLSPDTSISSASYGGSPVSSTSTSSSAVGLDSPFASPVSHLGDLSPDAVRTPCTPFATPVARLESLSPRTPQTPYSTPLSYPRKLSPEAAQTSTSASLPIGLSPSHPYHPFISSLYISSSGKTQNANKGSTSSLVQRRGGVQPSLQLPGSENEPPPAPRGMSRKPKLPPIVTAEKHRVEPASEAMESTSMGSEAVGEMSKSSIGAIQDPAVEDMSHGASVPDFIMDGAAAPSDAASSKFLNEVPDEGRPLLYSLPDLERIDMFDTDDLDTSGAFLLLAPHTHQSNQGMRVFVWVGSQLKTNPMPNSCTEGDGIWHQAGQEFLERMLLPHDVPIRVVDEGQESEEFWELFNED
ncbi:hypothetical protein GOP47_0009078 [Adiantum capillus-veneris]|uniref:Protein-tyrosine-phosphatase MKP1 n=1 Tax=Adiantum capillus-veneris TaxID=13818 RepID=A0A9D4V0G6_ADICA|nr:hypothetical protein GOP47_0009078 [Adiantum capillus-veneris]